jgi:hypothetical protein
MSFVITSSVNYVAVVVTAIVAMIVGALWYSPILFGNAWMKLSGISKKDLDAAKKKGMGKSYLLCFVAALVTAFVLANLLMNLGASVNNGLMTAFWIWLGFGATIMINSVLWDGKPWGYYFIITGHYLVSLEVMGIILGAWLS